MPASPGEDHRYLLSRSSLDSYLEFVADYSLDPAGVNRKEHAESWKAADLHMRKLRASEPDKADGETTKPLPKGLKNLTAKVEADPVFQKAFEDATWEIRLVDLEKVVVSQKLVSEKHIERLKERIAAIANEKDLFRFCLPYDREPTPHRMSRIGEHEFGFVSQSNDLRFLEAVLLRPDQIVGYQSTGPIAGVVALVVGFGSNYLSVIEANGRLILNNGHHRSCALSLAGKRWVPCVVQKITHPGEFEVHMPRAVRNNAEFYLSEPRPPLVADYFDPILSRRFSLGLTTKHVRLSYTVDEKDMP
jgi:hypothetical protein